MLWLKVLCRWQVLCLCLSGTNEIPFSLVGLITLSCQLTWIVMLKVEACSSWNDKEMTCYSIAGRIQMSDVVIQWERALLKIWCVYTSRQWRAHYGAGLMMLQIQKKAIPFSLLQCFVGQLRQFCIHDTQKFSGKNVHTVCSTVFRECRCWSWWAIIARLTATW